MRKRKRAPKLVSLSISRQPSFLSVRRLISVLKVNRAISDTSRDVYTMILPDRRRCSGAKYPSIKFLVRAPKVALEIEAERKEETDVEWRRTEGVSFQPVKVFFRRADAKPFLSRPLRARPNPVAWMRSDDQIVKLSVAVITTVITGRNNTYRHSGGIRTHGVSNKVEEGRSEDAGAARRGAAVPVPCQKHPVSTSRFSRFLSSLTFSRQCSRNPPFPPSAPACPPHPAPAVRRGVTKRDDNEIRPSVSKTMSGVGRARTVIRGFVHVRRKWADIVPYNVKPLLKHCCKG